MSSMTMNSALIQFNCSKIHPYFLLRCGEGSATYNKDVLIMFEPTEKDTQVSTHFTQWMYRAFPIDPDLEHALHSRSPEDPISAISYGLVHVSNFQLLQLVNMCGGSKDNYRHLVSHQMTFPGSDTDKYNIEKITTIDGTEFYICHDPSVHPRRYCVEIRYNRVSANTFIKHFNYVNEWETTPDEDVSEPLSSVKKMSDVFIRCLMLNKDTTVRHLHIEPSDMLLVRETQYADCPVQVYLASGDEIYVLDFQSQGGYRPEISITNNISLTISKCPESGIKYLLMSAILSSSSPGVYTTVRDDNSSARYVFTVELSEDMEEFISKLDSTLLRRVFF